MNQEEKANELIEKFPKECGYGSACDFCFICLDGYCKVNNSSSIECALILCDELLKYLSPYGTKHDFWQGVKENLLKLKQ